MVLASLATLAGGDWSLILSYAIRSLSVVEFCSLLHSVVVVFHCFSSRFSLFSQVNSGSFRFGFPEARTVRCFQSRTFLGVFSVPFLLQLFFRFFIILFYFIFSSVSGSHHLYCERFVLLEKSDQGKHWLKRGAD